MFLIYIKIIIYQFLPKFLPSSFVNKENKIQMLLNCSKLEDRKNNITIKISTPEQTGDLINYLFNRKQ